MRAKEFQTPQAISTAFFYEIDQIAMGPSGTVMLTSRNGLWKSVKQDKQISNGARKRHKDEGQWHEALAKYKYNVFCIFLTEDMRGAESVTRN